MQCYRSILWTLYTSDNSTTPDIQIWKFAHDAGILDDRANIQSRAINLQTDIGIMQNWLNEWKIKMNES